MSRQQAKKPAEGEVTVLLIGPSHNGRHGEERVVSAEQAKSLVARGLARYPDVDATE